MSHRIIIADVMDGLRQLDDESVQCIVTSPPYWNLRNYGVDGQIGLEPTISEYVEKMRDVFRECKRVLRNDGTLWLNLGDSYAGGGTVGRNDTDAASLARRAAKYGTGQQSGSFVGKHGTKPKAAGLKEKDLCGIPWRTAFALQDDGWYLRKDIIWAKPNPMPESVRDRPTSAHEYIFLLTKSPKYFYDADAIREDFVYAGGTVVDKVHPSSAARGIDDGTHDRSNSGGFPHTTEGRNARSVWTIVSEPYSGSHYAVFPSELPRRCILAGTSAYGACAACGAAHERVSDVTRGERDDSTRDPEKAAARIGMAAVPEKGWESTRLTTGWQPNCNCNAETVPCTVLDPFAGSGTTVQVAIELGRDVIGIDLDERNRALIEKRILGTTPPLEGIA